MAKVIKTENVIARNNFKPALKKVEDSLGDSFAKFMFKIERAAKQKSPFRKGINVAKIRVQFDKKKLTGQLFTESGYGGLLEIGTGIHGRTGQAITPKTKKVLRWVDAGGNVVFARFSKGMKPRPYIRPAVMENRDEYFKIAKAALARES